MKYFWYGVSLQDKADILSGGLMLSRGAVLREGSDFMIQRGKFARRSLSRAIDDANAVAKEKLSVPMILRIAVETNNLRKTEADQSIINYPQSHPDVIVETVARVAMIISNAKRPASQIMNLMPDYDLFIENIVSGFGLPDRDSLLKSRSAIDAMYFRALMLAVMKVVDWQGRVRVIMANMDPGGNWINQTKDGKYIYNFPSPLNEFMSFEKTQAMQTRAFKLLAGSYTRGLLKLPVAVLKNPANPIRIDMAFAIIAAFPVVTRKTVNRPSVQVTKYHCSIDLGVVDADFVKAWSAAIGPVENISWENNRGV